MTGSDNKAKKYALRLLIYRGRSEKEMEERLQKKGHSSRVIASTIKYLRDMGFLNDFTLAEALKREALANRMLSQYAARKFVLSRGIPVSIVDAIFGASEQSDFESAVRLAGKKLGVLGKYPAVTARRRLYNFLLRRGYSTGTIMKVLKATTMKEDAQ